MNSAFKYFIVIPTYNEAENIGKLIKEILQLPYDFEILVIDDNSKDGTGEKVKELTVHDNRISSIQRPSKLGYASAVKEGFKYALNHKVDAVIQMDADFSHSPAYLKEFVNYIESYQVVIGSRYIKGGGTVNWSLKRKALSYFANIYVRIFTGMEIHDATTGYRIYRKEVLEGINFEQIKSDGYAFIIEMSFLCWQKGVSFKEIPIVFVEREKGFSKISKRIIWEAFFLVLRLSGKRFLNYFAKKR